MTYTFKTKGHFKKVHSKKESKSLFKSKAPSGKSPADCVIISILTLVFLSQCYIAWVKLKREDVAQATKRVDGTQDLIYPEVTLCREAGTLEEILQDANASNNPFYDFFSDDNKSPPLVVVVEHGTRDLLNLTQHTDDELEIIRQSILVVEDSGVFNCISVSSPFPTPTGFLNQLIVGFMPHPRDAELVERSVLPGKYLMFIAERGNSVPSNLKIVGMDFSLVDLTLDRSIYRYFDFERSRKKLLPSDSWPCVEERTRMLSNCLHDYLEKQIDCHLPYHHFHDKSLGLKNCSTLLEFQTWLQYLMDFQGLTENKLATELGCAPKCQRDIFTVREIGNGLPLTYMIPDDQILNAWNFVIAQTQFDETKEVRIYTFPSFFAELGGLLGLLLGASILTFYNSIKAHLSKHFKRKGLGNRSKKISDSSYRKK